MAHDKLFAVYLGGSAPKANTELHDVVFATGHVIEDTYEQLLERWFGNSEGLHIDSWLELDVVDGHRITLGERAPEGSERLYFVNLGAYKDDEFSEIHANRFVVATSPQNAKRRAKRELSKAGHASVHTDYLYDVDTCIAVESVEALHVVLTRTDETSAMRPHNAYHVLPRTVIAAYVARRAKSSLP